jgi:hypothetical protein
MNGNGTGDEEMTGFYTSAVLLHISRPFLCRTLFVKSPSCDNRMTVLLVMSTCKTGAYETETVIVQIKYTCSWRRVRYILFYDLQRINAVKCERD